MASIHTLLGPNSFLNHSRWCSSFSKCSNRFPNNNNHMQGPLTPIVHLLSSNNNRSWCSKMLPWWVSHIKWTAKIQGRHSRSNNWYQAWRLIHLNLRKFWIIRGAMSLRSSLRLSKSKLYKLSDNSKCRKSRNRILNSIIARKWPKSRIKCKTQLFWPNHSWDNFRLWAVHLVARLTAKSSRCSWAHKRQIRSLRKGQPMVARLLRKRLTKLRGLSLGHLWMV